MAGRFPESDLTAELRQCGCTEDIVYENSQFVVDSINQSINQEIF